MNFKIHLTRLTAIVALIGSSASCITSYDAYGRPLQTVDPALAVAGVAAAGLLAYAAGNNNSHHSHHRYHSGYSGGYHDGGGYYQGGGYRRTGYVRGR